MAPSPGSPRTLGLLGGMSAESSLEYERLINAEVRRALGGSHSASLLVRSYDFADIEVLQSRGAWREAGALLARDAQRLQAAGAELIVLCSNTMHRVAPDIEAAIEVPFLHIVDATAAAVRAAGLSHVGLLGTRFTMEGDFYRDRLAAGGVTTLVPDEPDRSLVHDIIYGELVQGILESGVAGAHRGRHRAAGSTRRTGCHRRMHGDRDAGDDRRRVPAVLPDDPAARPGGGSLVTRRDRPRRAPRGRHHDDGSGTERMMSR